MPFPRIHIRSMDTRWGSCLPQKAIITLNRHLLEMPVSCIDMIIENVKTVALRRFA
ncbi:M48 metallopeptidase family protein [Faecalibacterium wellingii]|uniref:M48 metallopeptidase family protein n=1 Tax=Faecalibacterium wellingii TaxID=2929491 RepID=UPI003ED89254